MPVQGGVLNSMLATVIDVSRLGDAAATVDHVEATKAHIRSSRVGLVMLWEGESGAGFGNGEAC